MKTAFEPVAQVHLSTAIRQGLRCRTGSEFQSTAQDILRHRLPEFTPIVPHGRDGDGGNDGYSKKLGIYTQIYAPDTIRLPGREAARKAVADFAKIQRRWSPITPLHEYWFVTNAPASNIHLEHALQKISSKHKVVTRFLGTAELTEHVVSLPAKRIEELMGFTVRGETPAERPTEHLDVLSSVTAPQLLGLHLLASLVHPVPRRFCEELLPKVIHWSAFWPWLRRQGWLATDSDYVELRDDVSKQCRKNVVEQR